MDDLISALRAARDLIARDRDGLRNFCRDFAIPIEGDADLREYDEALAQIDAALAGAGGER